MLCRALLPLLMYIGAGSAAPQDSQITYIQPPSEQNVTENSTGLRESRIEKIPLTIPSKTEETTTEFREITTNLPEEYPTTTKPTTTPLHHSHYTSPSPKYSRKYQYTQTQTKVPRFYSNLNYAKPSDNSLSTNLIDDLRAGKRRYKSKCRCEKIWNCPKLQITVPRCPNEYFLCCF